MGNLRLAGSAGATSSKLQSDEYVGMALTLSDPDLDDQLILTVDGESGGWLEMVLDTRDGSVATVTVTSPLPRADIEALPSGIRRHRELPRLDIIDLLDRSSRAGPARILQMTCPLYEGVRGQAKVVGFAPGPVLSVFESVHVRFGFDANDDLVELVVEPDLLERAERF